MQLAAGSRKEEVAKERITKPSDDDISLHDVSGLVQEPVAQYSGSGADRGYCCARPSITRPPLCPTDVSITHDGYCDWPASERVREANRLIQDEQWGDYARNSKADSVVAGTDLGTRAARNLPGRGSRPAGHDHRGYDSHAIEKRAKDSLEKLAELSDLAKEHGDYWRTA